VHGEHEPVVLCVGSRVLSAELPRLLRMK
jgi:hypothetical protein